MLDFQYSDGGREKSGFKGKTGDCLVRAIAIAENCNYKEVYNDYKNFLPKGHTPRKGSSKKLQEKYLKRRGWKWQTLTYVGQKEKTHMRKDELPKGTIITSLSRHFATVIDGTVYDNHDCRRGGTRLVYGYWYKD